MGSLSLRESLIGAWELVSAVERDVETGFENNVLGERPQGFILYTPDGYMSAQLQGLARAPFAEGDLLRGSPAEYIAAGSSYIAFSGGFFVEEAKRGLSNERAVSFFPKGVGQRQGRRVKVDRERLKLSPDGPQRFKGPLKTATIHWRRAQPNLM